jgi:hypothetical protein
LIFTHLKLTLSVDFSFGYSIWFKKIPSEL